MLKRNVTATFSNISALTHPNNNRDNQNKVRKNSISPVQSENMTPPH